MKTILILVFSFILFAIAAQSVEAQNRFSAEIRSGADFSSQIKSDGDLKYGWGIQGNLAYRFMPHVSVYTGWGWNKFSAEDAFAAAGSEFEMTGYSLGLHFQHPLGISNLDYFLKAGGIYSHFEFEDSSGDIFIDSGHGLGWQADFGLAIPLGNSWELMPGVQFRTLTREIKMGNTSTDLVLRNMELGVGISRSF
jgi:hypothetical protein